MPRWRKVWLREYPGKRGTTYRVSFYDTQVKARRTIRTFHAKHLAEAFVNDYENFLNGLGANPATQVDERKAKAPARLWSEATAEWIAGGATRDKTRRTYRSLLREFGAQANAHCVEDVL